MKSSIRRRVTALLAAAGLLVAGQAAPAQAAVSVSIGGDTDWKVTATATTDATTLKVGQKMTGTAEITFEARVLGLPLPATGYYANSFPTTFSKPSLTQGNADVDSLYYSKRRNNFLKTRQWEVRGHKSFWGDMSVTITGEGRAATVGSNRHFYAGTISCGSDCTNANAYTAVNVTR